MNNEWIHWIVTQLRKNEAPLLLVNYRPITLRNIIYNIWAGGLGGRRTPILNLLTDEAQTEYKTDQCVPDYLSFIGNEVGNARQTYMCVSKVFDIDGWDTLGHTIRKMGPWRYTRGLQQGRNGAHLRRKVDGQLANDTDNKGVAQWIPISAKLFKIYFDAMMNGYGKATPEDIRQTQDAAIGRANSPNPNGQPMSGAMRTSARKRQPKPPRM